MLERVSALVNQAVELVPPVECSVLTSRSHPEDPELLVQLEVTVRRRADVVEELRQQLQAP